MSQLNLIAQHILQIPFLSKILLFSYSDPFFWYQISAVALPQPWRARRAWTPLPVARSARCGRRGPSDRISPRLSARRAVRGKGLARAQRACRHACGRPCLHARVWVAGAWPRCRACSPRRSAHMQGADVHGVLSSTCVAARTWKGQPPCLQQCFCHPQRHCRRAWIAKEVPHRKTLGETP